jgi:hypothetical protein
MGENLIPFCRAKRSIRSQSSHRLLNDPTARTMTNATIAMNPRNSTSGSTAKTGLPLSAAAASTIVDIAPPSASMPSATGTTMTMPMIWFGFQFAQVAPLAFACCFHAATSSREAGVSRGSKSIAVVCMLPLSPTRAHHGPPQHRLIAQWRVIDSDSSGR